MVEKLKAKISAYDRYIDYKRFSIAVGLFVVILLLPIPDSMMDVAVEYAVGKESVENFLSQEMFTKNFNEVEQWQKFTVEVMNAVMMQGASKKETLLKRKAKDLQKMGLDVDEAHFNRYHEFVSTMDAGEVNRLLTRAFADGHCER